MARSRPISEPDAAWLRSADVASILQDAHRRTLELFEDLSDEQLRTPLLPIVNPPLWEVGHVGWFHEKWLLRHLRGRPPILSQGDALFDSAAVVHDTRWDLPLLSRQETLNYLDEVLRRILDQLPPKELSQEEAYFHWLAVMHEDMHGEAFTYTRQTLAYPAPRLSTRGPDSPSPAETAPGDVVIPGGEYLLGAEPGELFVFDNEQWAHPVGVEPFRIARTAVTNGEFAAFVDDGGYRRREFWSKDGWQWREKTGATHPVYWIPDAAGWQVRHFDQGRALPRDLPVIHVNWYEAEAYCRWAGRRLPTEAEWELAASTAPGELTARRRYPWGEEPPAPERANLNGVGRGCVPANALEAGESAFGCRQMLGNVWEWTASTFAPYPGFTPGPYKEYSQPWFPDQSGTYWWNSQPWFSGPYKVLRGGCWATRSRLIRNTWRNFYTRDRRDVFAGFRTCAL
ncbi:MAG: selenoneine synthase SenA [Terriglobia bacterium]